MTKTLLAATAIAALLCGTAPAQAQLVRVHGVVTQTHAGTMNFGFVVNDQLYVIPQIGFGEVTQSLKVLLAKSDHMPIDFNADTSQPITIHGGNVGLLAKDIDP